jgi:integrase
VPLTLIETGAIRVEVKHLQLKGRTYYFRRRIPEHVRQLYPGRKRELFFSLKTSDLTEAAKKADRHARQQDALWTAHQNGDVEYGPEVHAAALAMLEAYGLKPGEYDKHWKGQDVEPDPFIWRLEALSGGEGEIIKEQLPPHARLAANLFYGIEKSVPFLSEALALYQSLKGEDDGTKEHSSRQRAVTKFLEGAGDMPVDRYAREHARAFVESLAAEGLKTTTIRRYVRYVSPVFNLAIREYELARPNIFDNIIIPRLGHDAKEVVPFTDDELLILQKACRDRDDDMRWLAALVSDTGMRLGEAVGLACSDVRLADAIPHVVVRWTDTRRVKTAHSERKVPLVGAALWAAERALENASGDHLFPRYIKSGKSSATSASNALAKWIKSLGIPKTTHALRHAMRDRLRNAGATEEIADRIGGWATKGVGQSYGSGHGLEVLHNWMVRTVDASLWGERSSLDPAALNRSKIQSYENSSGQDQCI